MKLGKTFGLVRVSTLGQKDNTSLEFQSKRINDYCKLYELPINRIITETESGGKNVDDRTGLSELKSLIDQGKCDTIVVNKVDRLGRNLLQGLQFIKYCEENSTRVISISENIDTLNPSSKLITNILYSIAEHERDTIKSRLSDGRERTFEMGKKCYGGRVSFGYRKNRNGEIVIHKDNSAIVQFIYQKWNQISKKKHLTKTKKTQTILTLLKKRGYTFNGNQFRTHNLKDILSNGLYCGVLKWKDRTTKSSYPTIISKRLYNQIGVV